MVTLGGLVSLAAFQNCDKTPLTGALVSKDAGSQRPTPTPTPGPNDVRYVLSGWTCGSTDLIGPAQLNFYIQSTFMDVTPSLVRRINRFFGSSCVRTQTFYHSYLNSSTLLLTHGPTECSSCPPEHCVPLGTPNPTMTTTYAVSQDASSITLTRGVTSIDVNDPTSVYNRASCLNGQLETMVYLRQ